MRHAVITLLAALMLSPVLTAKDKSDWRNVEKLKPGTSVVVEYWNGSRVRGRIESVDDSELVLVPRYPNPHPGLVRPVDRTAIWKIVRSGKRQKLPDMGKCAVIGSVVLGAGLAIEAGIDSGTSVGTLLGGSIGALGGYGFGPAACGLAVMVSLPFTLRVPKLVYQDIGPKPLPAVSP